MDDNEASSRTRIARYLTFPCYLIAFLSWLVKLIIDIITCSNEHLCAWQSPLISFIPAIVFGVLAAVRAPLWFALWCCNRTTLHHHVASNDDPSSSGRSQHKATVTSSSANKSKKGVTIERSGILDMDENEEVVLQPEDDVHDDEHDLELRTVHHNNDNNNNRNINGHHDDEPSSTAESVRHVTSLYTLSPEMATEELERLQGRIRNDREATMMTLASLLLLITSVITVPSPNAFVSFIVIVFGLSLWYQCYIIVSCPQSTLFHESLR
jgi:hypothetical protein